MVTNANWMEHQIRLTACRGSIPCSLIAHPGYLRYLEEFMDQPQTWSISKYPGRGATHWHHGLPPEDYSVRDGKIRSPMLNVVTMLTPRETAAWRLYPARTRGTSSST